MRKYQGSGPWRRLVRRTAATRPLAWLYGRVQQPVDLFLHRLTGGRLTLTGVLADVRLVMLTTTGARTGQARVSPVLAVPAAEGLVVLASNFGRPHHPGWYHNLRSDPRAVAVLDGVVLRVRAVELVGEERARAFRRAVEIYPGFERYVQRAAPRVIPVLRLQEEEP